MNSVDKQYFDLIRHIKEFGTEKLDRTGTGTKSVFSYDMRFNMQEGFPLITSKKMAWKAMVVELIWFLKGDTNIKYLVDNGCYIWVGDAYKNYLKYPLADISNKDTNILWKNISKGWCIRIGLGIVEPDPTRHLTREEFIEKIKIDDEFAAKWGELGPVYGKQWRSWKYYKRGNKLLDIPGWEDKDWDFHTEHGEGELDNIGEFRIFDQIANLINDLKTNPDSRRLMVNAWNVGEIDSMVLPPCHYGFQCYTRELTLKERHQLVRQYGLCPKYGFDIIDGKAVPLPITEMEHYDNYNVPKRALSLKWTQRSVDTGLGLPFNIASYGLLLQLLALEVNMVPDELIFSGGDVHIYMNHLDGLNKQLKQQSHKLPTVKIQNFKSIFEVNIDDIVLENYVSSETIKLPLSN
jgi:thymidylate synthase